MPSFNRHNEVNLNFAYLQAEYSAERVRGKLALMTGTYANANLADEPGVLKNIFEANIGVKLSTRRNLWLEAGIFASHIGFESAIGADCWTMTRSLAAENSPYYFSGAKLSYQSDDEKWLLSILYLNGWQRIQRPRNNQVPAFGHQIQWTPSAKLMFNSSSFVGSDTDDPLVLMRYFHNFYTQWQPWQRWSILAGFDIGLEAKAPDNTTEFNRWYTPQLLVRYQLSKRIFIATRGEYYSDPNVVIIQTGTPNGLQAAGYTLNIDYRLTPQVLWRLEGRGLHATERVFVQGAAPAYDNFLLGTSLSLRLE